MYDTQFKGLVVQSKEELLFKYNTPVKQSVIDTNNLERQTINIGYSIQSDNPSKINEAIQSGKCNIKKVILTTGYNCTLEGELTSQNHIHYWKTAEEIKPFRKIFYSGTNPGEISNNFDLWNAQILTMEKAIKSWASKTAYSGSFASSLVSLDMADYVIHFNDPTTDTTSNYKTKNCEELLRVLKSESTLPLVYNSKYESVNCFYVPWNSFNKRSIFDLMISVNGITNSPIAVPRDGENYTSTLCVESLPELDVDYSPNTFARTAFETLSLTPNNYVRLMNNVFVDAFEPIDGVPTLLQLVFFTDFWFNIKTESEDTYDGCEKIDPHYNPDTSVSAPLESN